MGYIEVTPDRKWIIDSIVTNEIPIGEPYIIVQEGQYLHL